MIPKKRIAALLCLALLLLPSFAMANTQPAKVSTFAGSGEWGSEDGGGSEASFRLPTYATMDQEGNIYVADTGNHLIRQIDQEGRVTTLAGKIVEYDEYGQPLGGSQDGSFSQARFNEPRGLAVASDGTLYVADSLNGSIRKLGTDGQVSTLISGLDFPSDIVLTPEDELYVTETLQHRLLKISTEGESSVVAGGGYSETDGMLVGGFQDGEGITAQFNEPTGLVLAEDRTLYIVDTGNQRIRALSPEGKVTTITGSGTELIAETGYMVGGFQDGAGSEARFNYPNSIAVAADGSLYVADTFNHRVRQITPSGEVHTVIGLERHGREDGIETKAALNHPTDVIVLPNSNLLIVDQWNQALRLVEWYRLPQGIEQDGSIQVVWNQQIITFDTPAENVNNRIMVPVRALAEAFGYEVEWDQAEQQITFRAGEEVISLQIGSTQVTGIQEIAMDVAPYIKDNRTFVPVRFVSEAFDKDARWLESSKTVLIRE